MFSLPEDEKLQKVKKSKELFDPLWKQLVEKSENIKCEHCNEATMIWSSKEGIYSLPLPCCIDFKMKLGFELDLIIGNYLIEIA